jgi:transcription elongation GreA/GreB family factor
VRDEQGEAMSFSVVFPGDGDPTEGWVSADSPLGAAVLGGHAGDVVHVDAPAGRWSAVIVGVD